VVQWNNPVRPYVYTRSFNLICAPESYRSLKISGNFGCDNTGTAALNGNPLPPGSGPSCYHNPPVPVGGIPFSHVGPSFFVQGLNSLTMTIINTPPGGPTGLSVVAKLEAECGTECLCKTIDLTIGKENTPQGGSGTSFNLWVTNVGTPITFPVGGLTVTDVIPAGMTVSSITSPNWTCTPTSLVGPGTLTCTYNLAGSLATGAQLPGSIVVNYTTTGPGPFTNCATISAGAVVGVDSNSVNNTACVTVTPSPGSLSVTKVVAPDPRGIGNTLSFPMTVACTNPTASYALNVLGNTSTLPINVPVGSQCSVTETLPSLPLGCTWLAPVYSPASVTIAAGLNHLTVTNAYQCREHGGSLIVKKEVIYVGPITLPSQIYPVTVNCGGTITNLNLLDGVPQTVSNIPLNTSCTVVEGPVPTPPNACPPSTTPVWTTAYVPPSPLTITGSGITELVRNTLICRPIQVSACPPPMVPGAVAGQCFCPPGTVLKGKECVRQIACRPPMIPGAVAGVCLCPEGTVKRGSRCVEPIVCRAPAKLNRRGVCECPADMVAKGKGCVARERRQPSLPDGIRNIPGEFRPGSGGRREPSGGGRGREGPTGGGGPGDAGGSPGRR
jgi:hypothetical protein